MKIRDQKSKIKMKGQAGIALLETTVALAILGMVVVGLLGGLTGAQKATSAADSRAEGQALAQSQMEYIKKLPYVYGANSYTPTAIPPDADYEGHSASITVTPVHPQDDGLQKVTVNISKGGRLVTSLDGYKEDR